MLDTWQRNAEERLNTKVNQNNFVIIVLYLKGMLFVSLVCINSKGGNCCHSLSVEGNISSQSFPKPLENARATMIITSAILVVVGDIFVMFLLIFFERFFVA